MAVVASRAPALEASAPSIDAGEAAPSTSLPRGTRSSYRARVSRDAFPPMSFAP